LPNKAMHHAYAGTWGEEAANRENIKNVLPRISRGRGRLKKGEKKEKRKDPGTNHRLSDSKNNEILPVTGAAPATSPCARRMEKKRTGAADECGVKIELGGKRKETKILAEALGKFVKGVNNGSRNMRWKESKWLGEEIGSLRNGKESKTPVDGKVDD